MTTRYAWLSIALIAACGDTTTTVPDQLNLDRPVDIAFACYGGLRITNGMPATADQDVTVTAQPLASCDFRSQPHAATDPVPTPPGQGEVPGGPLVPGASYYAFILQSATGTVAIARWDTKPASAFAGGDVTVLDADPLTPGKNGISVGEEPIAIASDSVGCYEVTANAGTCDLSAIEINSALQLDNSSRVDRMDVKNAAGEVIRAKPIAMAAEPQNGTIGVACPTDPTPMTPTGLMYVAYPSCHLVAAIDVSTATIVGGIQYDAAGTATILPDGNVSCPAECGGGGVITPGVRPVTLSLELDPASDRRVLAIGADNSNILTVVELGGSRGRNNMPVSIQPIVLQNTTGKLGVTSVAVTPQIGMGGSMGMINDDTAPGGTFQFVYAVATDNTVRVADILTVNKECDTQVDPRSLHDSKNIHQMSCMPVGDALTPARRSGARGPGVEIVGDAIPTSVGIFKVDGPRPAGVLPGTPSVLVGYYAVVSGSNGATYVINIDNDDFADFTSTADPLGTQIPLAIAHQLRDQIPTRGLLPTTQIDDGAGHMIDVPICQSTGPNPDASGNAGGARAVANPTRTFPGGIFATEKAAELPSIHQVLCTGHDTTMPVSELSFAAPVPVRDLEFPDLRGLRSDETWTLSWEGSLSNDSADSALDGPSIRESQIYVDADGMRIIDQTRPFCDAGVEPYDVVQLRGCDPSIGDLDCALGYRCFVHPNSQVAGLGACMLADEADRLANACKEFLTSLRRYTVGTTASGELQLLPRKYVLRTTPIDGCTSDDQCAALATYADKNLSSANPVDDMTPNNPRTWACVVDSDRKPVPGTGKRCVETCAVDADCFAGRVCQGATAGVPASGYCMEGVIPPQACINAAQRYELRAGEAFAVLGTRSGYVHPIIADAGGKCVRDPSASPWQIGRIPLTAPPCDPTTNPRTGKKPDGTYDANPCSLTIDNVENDTAYVAGTCTLDPMSPVLTTRPAPAVQFRSRGMTLTMVDPTYPGDAMCIGDRAGGLGNIPLVFPGYQLSFRQTGGFTPLNIPINPAYPVKVVRGPGESIWVIDEGDFLSTSISAPSTRGKVFRVESTSLSTSSLLQ